MIPDGRCSEPVAVALRDHQAQIKDWRYGSLARELHRWVEIFDLEFELQLPSYPVLKFAPIRNAYATYAWFRGEIGTRDNITFNTHELDRDAALIIRTLLHELIHLWQHYHGRPATGNGYHNVEFRTRAAGCGLIVTEQGCTTGHTALFTAVLAKHGVHIAPLAVERKVYGSKGLAKEAVARWSCGCTVVRCKEELRARCEECGSRFRLC